MLLSDEGVEPEPRLLTGELGDGDEGPGLDEAEMAGVGLEEVGWGDLDFPSLDFPRERFWLISVEPDGREGCWGRGVEK